MNRDDKEFVVQKIRAQYEEKKNLEKELLNYGSYWQKEDDFWCYHNCCGYVDDGLFLSNI